MSSPISGFTAIPNPQMLAFMPIQSYLMMYFAGAGWQIGKRKISAIPNPKFNKMSVNELLKGFTADLKESIPTLESSLQDITPLIGVLVEQYGDFVREALRAMPGMLENIFGPQTPEIGSLPGPKSPDFITPEGKLKPPPLTIPRSPISSSKKSTVDPGIRIKARLRSLQSQISNVHVVILAQKRRLVKETKQHLKVRLRASIALFEKKRLVLVTEINAITSNPANKKYLTGFQF